jgi:hypothetical protein
MKKVIKTEKANLSEEEKSKHIVRSLKAIYLATLLAFTSYATIDSINRIKAQSESFFDELDDYDKYEEYAIIEDNLLAEIDMGNSITLKIFKPVTAEQKGSPEVEENYIEENGLCYKLISSGEVPNGYTKLEDGTLIRNEDYELSPEGYIIVGNKAIDVVSPQDSVKNGYRYFTLPKGYILIGNVGVGIFEYQKERQKALKLR